MEAIFLKILNMGITAGWLILAVFLLRLLLKKAPKWISCLLWGHVGIRLIIPFSIQSVFSLIPSSETVPADIGSVQHPAIDSGISALNEAVNPVLSAAFAPQTAQSVNPMQILVTAAAAVWLAGVFVMLLYALVRFLKMKRSVRTAAPKRGNIMVCDEIESPFILGVFKPVIYIPSSLQAETAAYVIEHEAAHLKRRDHLFKPFGFLLLSVYWFNPLCWAAYALLCRVIEQACDEKVIRGKEKETVAAYSQALLDCSFQKKRIAACPLAFGEVGVKQRVKGVLNYKKPVFWIVLFAVIACIVFSVCFMTDPFTGKRLPDRLGISMDMAIAEHNASTKTDVRFSTAAYDLLQVSRKSGETMIYAYVVYAEYGFDGTSIVREAISRSPVAVTFDTASAKGDVACYDVLLYRTPRDGSYYESDIREIFPFGARIKLWRNGFSTKEADRLEEQCLLAAREYFGLDADGAVSFTFPGDAASAGVQHTIGGRLEERTLEGREFTQLKAWFSNLKCTEESFEPGQTPGDGNGGEVYFITVFSENGSASYSYVKNGNGKVYLVVGETWYWVKNASDPPVSFDAAAEPSAAEPSAVAPETDIRTDVCELYLKVLEDLWNVDPGLNDRISQIGIDLSELSHLTESEKETVMHEFAAKHNLPYIAGTWEELCEQGYIDKDNLYWEDGLFFSIKTNEDAAWNLPTIKEGDSISELAAFDAQKWRSGLGAYYFGQCTAQKNADGEWTYTVAQEAIS